MNNVELHDAANDFFAALLANVTADQLSAPSPCAGWEARDVINHVIGGNLRYAAILDGEPNASAGDRLVAFLGRQPWCQTFF